jgi:hypothetical protein
VKVSQTNIGGVERMPNRRLLDADAVWAFAYDMGPQIQSKQDREAWFRALEEFDFSQGNQWAQRRIRKLTKMFRKLNRMPREKGRRV